jgi:hypothetical protein
MSKDLKMLEEAMLIFRDLEKKALLAKILNPRVLSNSILDNIQETARKLEMFKHNKWGSGRQYRDLKDVIRTLDSTLSEKLSKGFEKIS